MAGIIFFKTKELSKITEFYQNRCGMQLWLDQGSCKIFSQANLLLGFCQRESCDLQGTITFFFASREEVDRIYQSLLDIAISAPILNPDYDIYHFWAKDPEGRSLEFQYFCSAVPDLIYSPSS